MRCALGLLCDVSASLATPNGPRQVHDGQADRVAILGPRAVVVADIISENLREHEPGVARSLADAAIDDDRLRSVDASRRVEPLQLIRRLDGAVFVDRAAPGY